MKFKKLIILALYVFLSCSDSQKGMSLSSWETANKSDLNEVRRKTDDDLLKWIVSNKEKDITSLGRREERSLFIKDVIEKDISYQNYDYLIVESESSGEVRVSLIDLFMNKGKSMEHFLFEIQDAKWILKQKEVDTKTVLMDSIFNSVGFSKLYQNETLHRHFSIILTYHYANTNKIKSNVFVAPSDKQIKDLFDLTKFKD